MTSLIPRSCEAAIEHPGTGEATRLDIVDALTAADGARLIAGTRGPRRPKALTRQ